MTHLRLFEEFDIDGYKSHWLKFMNWLSDKDFDLYDGEEDLHDKFMEVANNDELAVEDKASEITNYLEDKWGLHGGYEDTFEYLDRLFMDEVNESLIRQHTLDQLKKLRKLTKGTDIGDRISDMNKEGSNIQYIQNPIDTGIESYEDFEKKNKSFVPSWNLKHLNSPYSKK